MLRERTYSLFTLAPPCLPTAPPAPAAAFPSLCLSAGLSHCTVPLSVDTSSERVLVVLTRVSGPSLRILEHNGGQKTQHVNTV